jgi:hypothetical protein
MSQKRTAEEAGLPPHYNSARRGRQGAGTNRPIQYFATEPFSMEQWEAEMDRFMQQALAPRGPTVSPYNFNGPAPQIWWQSSYNFGGINGLVSFNPPNLSQNYLCDIQTGNLVPILPPRLPPVEEPPPWAPIGNPGVPPRGANPNIQGVNAQNAAPPRARSSETTLTTAEGPCVIPHWDDFEKQEDLIKWCLEPRFEGKSIVELELDVPEGSNPDSRWRTHSSESNTRIYELSCYWKRLKTVEVAKVRGCEPSKLKLMLAASKQLTKEFKFRKVSKILWKCWQDAEGL